MHGRISDDAPLPRTHVRRQLLLSRRAPPESDRQIARDTRWRLCAANISSRSDPSMRRAVPALKTLGSAGRHEISGPWAVETMAGLAGRGDEKQYRAIIARNANRKRTFPRTQDC
jgi:hypothetical protein